MATEPEDPVEKRARIREEISSETGEKQEEEDIRTPTTHGGLTDDAGSGGVGDES